jgi:hypothetical protein
VVAEAFLAEVHEQPEALVRLVEARSEVEAVAGALAERFEPDRPAGLTKVTLAE